MKTPEQWFAEYAESHQNETNTKIHFVCVPAIYFSIIGLLVSIPTGFLNKITAFDAPILINWAIVVSIPVMIFYLRLSFAIFMEMFAFTLICIVLAYMLGQSVPLVYASLAIFIVAWAGQFYGHKIEGKKPSFFKDLQFLLIGPVWVFEKMMGRKA